MYRHNCYDIVCGSYEAILLRSVCFWTETKQTRSHALWLVLTHGNICSLHYLRFFLYCCL
jgi:hypothetical protein